MDTAPKDFGFQPKPGSLFRSPYSRHHSILGDIGGLILALFI